MIVSKIKAFWKDEEGASLIEYVLLAALIGVAAITAMIAVGTQASDTLEYAAEKMGSY
ncbi:MAG: pilus assembly protein Flp/PilA [Desulforhopalus sp.]|jgi:pilus assembly protein Flp/PilA